MDLTAIPGIGSAYGERLRNAGIEDVEDLARAPDLSSLSEWSGIAPSRLASLQASALALLNRTPSEGAGIILDAPPRRASFRARTAAVVRTAQIRLYAAAGAVGAALRPGQKKSA